MDRSCFLTGPHGIGKKSFVTEIVSLLPEEDTIIVDPGVDGARTAVDFLFTRSVTAPFRVVVVADIDLMQLPAQDAYLKVFEEPPFLSKIIFIADDDSLLSPALKSRIRFISRWRCLSDEEMLLFADTFGKINSFNLHYSCGHPGVYHVIHDDVRIEPFVESIKKVLLGTKNLLLEKVPVIIAEIDAKSPIRIPLSQVLTKAASECIGTCSPDRIACVLKYASLLYSSPAVNAEIHWMRMITDLEK